MVILFLLEVFAMHKQITLVFATVALSTAAFAQSDDLNYHIGYAAT